jgi:hypothetical protein
VNQETRGETYSSRPRRRWWVLLSLLTILGLGVAAYFVLRPTPDTLVLAEAGQLRSAVEQKGDSLQVVVQWQLFTPPGAEPAESLRVEVRADSMGSSAARVRVLPGLRRQDTVYVPAPAAGETIDGLSCVAVQHRSIMSRETCTPWRYVRPLAGPPETERSKNRREVGGTEPARIVVQPSGLQVDPDIGGRCAAWQRRNPTASVWIEVNRVAVRECTGPNNRPTVAQFCAFAELSDGRRIKTANSANIPYCDELFRAWARQRIS